MPGTSRPARKASSASRGTELSEPPAVSPKLPSQDVQEGIGVQSLLQLASAALLGLQQSRRGKIKRKFN